jgi:hypothetical protein
MPHSACATILIALALSVASAGTVAVPASPESPFADTEAVTNAAVRASLIQRARTFSGNIALYATPSNALEVAFGTSRNGGGILLPGDETLSIGWENGAWFLASPTNRVTSAAQDGTARRNLSFSIRVSEEGVPTRFTVSADGLGDAFATLTNAPPLWLFSRDWDAVRVTANGVDATAEAVGIRLDNDPWLFIAR